MVYTLSLGLSGPTLISRSWPIFFREGHSLQHLGDKGIAGQGGIGPLAGIGGVPASVGVVNRVLIRLNEQSHFMMCKFPLLGCTRQRHRIGIGLSLRGAA